MSFQMSFDPRIVHDKLLRSHIYNKIVSMNLGNKIYCHPSAPCCLLIGVKVLFLSIFIGYCVIPYIIHELIMKESKLIQSDNPRYNAWAKVPFPLYHNIYLFNVTNPEEVLNGAIPNMQQLGPYVYQMALEKFVIQFNPNNGTYFYRERIDYWFRPDLSHGAESDPITFPNLPYVGAVQEVSILGAVPRYVLLETMKEHPNISLFLYTTVGEIIFGGIPLPFLKDLAEMQGEGPILTNHTFGIMYGQNGSNLGLHEVFSGQNHPDRFGDIVSWNGDKTWKWWDTDPYCGKFNGSEGVFKPFATKQSIYHMFMSGLCRSLPFEFETETVELDIPVLKYSLPKSFTENPVDNPDNACYFASVAKPYPDSGVFPMRGCGRGPMMLSQPHFYQGSPHYLEKVKGLLPNKQKHEMSIYLEPYTGVPVRVHVRFQLNVQLQPSKYFKPLKKVPKMVYPLFWMEHLSECPKIYAEMIKQKLVVTLQIIDMVIKVSVGVGFMLTVTSSSVYAWKMWTNSRCLDPRNKRKSNGKYSSVTTATGVADSLLLTKSVPTNIEIMFNED